MGIDDVHVSSAIRHWLIHSFFLTSQSINATVLWEKPFQQNQSRQHCDAMFSTDVGLHFFRCFHVPSICSAPAMMVLLALPHKRPRKWWVLVKNGLKKMGGWLGPSWIFCEGNACCNPAPTPTPAVQHGDDLRMVYEKCLRTPVVWKFGKRPRKKNCHLTLW